MARVESHSIERMGERMPSMYAMASCRRFPGKYSSSSSRDSSIFHMPNRPPFSICSFLISIYRSWVTYVRLFLYSIVMLFGDVPHLRDPFLAHLLGQKRVLLVGETLFSFWEITF